MDEPKREKASLDVFPPPCQGDASSRDLTGAPSSLPRPSSTSAGPAARGLFRGKVPARKGPPRKLLPETEVKSLGKGVCLLPCTPSQGATPRSSKRFAHLGLTQECPAQQAGSRGLCFPSAMPPSLWRQPKDLARSRGDVPPAWRGLLSGGIIWTAAPLDLEAGVQPACHSPPNVCILTLAMMIAGIPTVPVPGIHEEDMILAAQNFVSGNLQPGRAGGEGAPQRRGAAAPSLGLACTRDVRRKPLPAPFLAQLEK